MTVIRPNSILGITSITAQGDTISLFKSDGSSIGALNLNVNASSGVSTFANLVATSDVTLRNQSDLRFGEDTANGTNFVAFQAPASVAADVTWTLPSSDAAVSGYALVSDAAGALSWAAGGGAAGGGSDKVFFENDQTITTNYTLTTNKNAMTAGPVTINSSIVVTIPSGASWVVV
jgi:hypothetical protein